MSEVDSSTTSTSTFKPKKSVALSGVTAGNTALCTVGLTGNDLHYRGYDILDIAGACEFEEIAYLLVHAKLPTAAELTAYKFKLKGLRGLPANLKAALECLPAAAHPMDVMRTVVSVLGTVLPEKDDHNLPGARDIADKPTPRGALEGALRGTPKAAPREVRCNFPVSEGRGAGTIYTISLRTLARLATVRSTLCSLSRPNSPIRNVLKSAGSSHCSGTPAPTCMPANVNFLADCMASSSV